MSDGTVDLTTWSFEAADMTPPRLVSVEPYTREEARAMVEQLRANGYCSLDYDWQSRLIATLALLLDKVEL